MKCNNKGCFLVVLLRGLTNSKQSVILTKLQWLRSNKMDIVTKTCYAITNWKSCLWEKLNLSIDKESSTNIMKSPFYTHLGIFTHGVAFIVARFAFKQIMCQAKNMSNFITKVY